MITIRQAEAVDLFPCAALSATYSTRTIWKFVLSGHTQRSGKPGTQTEDTVPDMPLLSFQVQRVRLPRPRLLNLPSAQVPLADVWNSCQARLVAVINDQQRQEAAPLDDTTSSNDPPPAHHAPVPIGYLLVKILPDQNQGMIERLLVDIAVRGSGVGTALIRTAREWARQQGLAALVAHTPLRNVPGITFYQQRGFRICGIIERFYITNEDALLLVRNL